MFRKNRLPQDETKVVDQGLIDWTRKRATPVGLKASLARALEGREVDTLKSVSVWWEEPGRLKVHFEFSEIPSEQQKDECYEVGSEVLSDFPDVHGIDEIISVHPAPAVSTIELVLPR